MPKLSYKERERLRREREILRTAAQIIHERGYANLNMDDVAEEVGISKPTIYQHFKSKDEMVVSTMLASVEESEAVLENLRDQAPMEQITGMMRHMLRTFYDEEQVPAIMLMEPSLHTMESYQRAMERVYKVGEKMSTIIKQGQDQGQIKADLPPRVIMYGFFSLLGVISRMTQEFDENFDAVSESIIRMYTDGIAAKQET